MGAAETIERIVAQCDFETQIIPYDAKYREQVWAGALEMHDNSTFREYELDPTKLFQQLEAADKYPDTLRFRQPCGEGQFDLLSFMRMLPASAPVNVEVINEELDKRAPADVAKHLFATTAALLEKCAGQ